MPNITIYLPNDLAQKSKKEGINISQICQRALRHTLKNKDITAELILYIDYETLDEKQANIIATRVQTLAAVLIGENKSLEITVKYQMPYPSRGETP